MNTKTKTKEKTSGIFKRMKYTFRIWLFTRKIRKLNSSLHLHFIDWYKDEWKRDTIVPLIAHNGFRKDLRIWFYNRLEIHYGYMTKHKDKSDLVTSLIRRQWREINEIIDSCIERNFIEQKSGQIKLTTTGKEFADSFMRFLNTILQDAEFGKISSFLFGAGIVGIIWFIFKIGWYYLIKLFT
jgi:hypothetical protein